MIRHWLARAVVLLVLGVGTLPLIAQTETDESAPPPETAKPNDRERLEDEFAQMLTGVDLVGHFTVTGQKTAPQEERYSIQGARKMIGDLWLITARIQYGKTDSVWPAPVKVKWAGDTPVITLTDVPVPGMGTFSARVVFFRGQYAGIWDAGDHGGQMYGRLEKRAEASDGPAPTDKGDGNWPAFRGEQARGHSDGYPLPTKWNVESGENVVFKIDVPGLAHSSPVIWGERLYLTTAVGANEGEAELKVGLYGSIAPVEDEGAQTFRVLCYDKHTGNLLWSQTAWGGMPQVKRHPKGSHAASSVATNGDRVVAFFGSEGLYCYDRDGKLLWKREDFGLLDSGYFSMPQAQWGFASSPVIHEDKIILQVDIQAQSWVGALSLETGEDLWRTEREEVPTWGTPTVHVGKQRSQVICNGWKHIGGYDLETGEALWWLEGGGDIPVPTPIVANDLAYITNAHGRHAPIYAIPLDASGKLSTLPTSKDLAWFHMRRGNYMQTPLVASDLLYCCNDLGVLSCFDAKTGDEIYRERLANTQMGGYGFTASGVSGDGKLYQASEDGEVYVVKLGPEFEILEVNSLKDPTMASPALSEGVLYFRTQHHLIAVGERRDG